MKSFVRCVLLLVAVTLLAGCVASTVDSPPVHPTPVPTSIAHSTLAAVVVSPAIPVTGSTSAAIPPNSADGDRQEVEYLTSSHKSGSGGVSASPSTRAAPVPTQALDPFAPTSTAFVIPVRATPPSSTALVAKPRHPLDGAELYVHVPPQANSRQPLRVLIALHGMGGGGDVFSQNLIREAEVNGWVLIAPTFQYRDYLDPKLLMEDDIQFAKRILDTLDVLPQRLNLKLHQHVLLYGFSRGAQLAHRFAYFYPDRVESVVTLSAGAYTMPTEKQSTDKGTQIVPFPYGVGDLQECVGQSLNWQALKRISFWVGVGAEDDQVSDVSRAFDQYGGKTRVERARAFQQALKALGIDVRLTVFPDATHEVTPEMRVGALQFLHDDEVADHWDD